MMSSLIKWSIIIRHSGWFNWMNLHVNVCVCVCACAGWEHLCIVLCQTIAPYRHKNSYIRGETAQGNTEQSVPKVPSETLYHTHTLTHTLTRTIRMCMSFNHPHMKRKTVLPGSTLDISHYFYLLLSLGISHDQSCRTWRGRRTIDHRTLMRTYIKHTGATLHWWRGKGWYSKSHNISLFPFKGEKSKTGGKKKREKKHRKEEGIATKMSSIISFFYASYFKEGIWRIYCSESLKHSWDVLKSMLQARQTELKTHYHQEFNCLHHPSVRCQNRS